MGKPGEHPLAAGRALSIRPTTVAAAITAVALGIGNTLGVLSWGPRGIDFANYYGAAMALRAGTPLYGQLPTAAGCPAPSPYVYPPLFAWLMQPLTLLPCGGAFLVWNAISAVLLGASLWLMQELWPQPLWRFILFCAAALLFEPMENGLDVGQIHFLTLAALLFVLWRIRHHDAIGAGFALALICWIQVLPGIFVVYLLLRREWRIVRAALISAAALLVVMLLATPSALLAWPRGIMTTNPHLYHIWTIGPINMFGIWIALPALAVYLLASPAMRFDEGYLWTITTMIVLTPPGLGYMLTWLLPIVFALWDRRAMRLAAPLLLAYCFVGMGGYWPLLTALLLGTWLIQLLPLTRSLLSRMGITAMVARAGG